MLHVTPEARVELHGLLMRALDERPHPEPAEDPLGLRLVAQGSEVGLSLDRRRDGDEVVEQDGRSVLIVDGTTAEQMVGMTLDVVETPEGVRLQPG